MKKLVFLLVTGLCVFGLSAIGQDSTAVAPVVNAGADFFSFLVSFVPAKYQAVALTTVTGLFLLEQFLASTSKVKANSTFQLVGGWVVAFFTAFKNKK